MGRTRFSRWNILTITAIAGLAYTTFQPVIQATVVHPSVAGSIFEIDGYVSGLAGVYAPWLGMMLSPGAGARTAKALLIADPALTTLCVIAICALVLVVASVVCNLLGKRKAARITGIIGFVLALIVPVASIALVGIVQAEMSSPVIAIDVLGVRPVCYAQIAIAIVGIFATIVSTHVVPDPKKA